MITNVKIFKIFRREIIAFNEKNYLVIVDGKVEYYLNCSRAFLLGVIADKLIVSIKNKHIISLNFPSLTLHRVLYKSSINTYTNSHSILWFQIENKVFCINTDMQISLYDDFAHVRLLKIIYLYELNTLAFIVKDRTEVKMHFENSLVPTLVFSHVSVIPEIIFESKYDIIISIGRSTFEYNLEKKQLQIIKIENHIEINWKSLKIIINYKIIETDVTIFDGVETRIYKIEGDVWRVINTEHALYLLSDAINTAISIHKIENNGTLFKFYAAQKSDYLVELNSGSKEEQSSFPILRLYPCKLSKSKSLTALFFIHGGPHQKAGNLWDPLLRACLQDNYCIYIPQYPGTYGVEDNDCIPSYGFDDFRNVLFHYDRVKQNHEKMIVVGHSYGAFLALKLFFHTEVDLLIGLNGVYELLTISSLNPKTYAHLDKRTKIACSPQHDAVRSGEWHHIQFKHDPFIQATDLENSINRIGGKGP